MFGINKESLDEGKLKKKIPRKSQKFYRKTKAISLYLYKRTRT